MDDVPGREPTTIDRRTVLRRGAVAGGALLWATPVVQAVGLRPVDAQTGTPPPRTFGRVQGTVTNATTGGPVAGAVVTVASTGQSTTTGADGTYQIADVPSGTQVLTASAAGFVTASATVVVPADGTEQENFALSPVGQVRAVLTWGPEPADLDLHMSGPDGSGGRFHVFYQRRTHSDYVVLDRDDTTSFGPETITVTVSPTFGGQYVAGDYHVWVHDYTNRGVPPAQWGISDASVRLFDEDTQRAELRVSEAVGDSTQDIWLVVRFTLDANGTMTNVVVQQTFAAGTDTDVF